MYTMKQVTEITGVAPSTLRYYEQENILPFIERNESGRRVYNDVNMEWIYFIRALRETDMPIRDIKEYVRLYMAGDGTRNDRKELLERHRRNVENKLKSQAHYLHRIERKLQTYEDIEANLNHTKETTNPMEIEK